MVEFWEILYGMVGYGMRRDMVIFSNRLFRSSGHLPTIVLISIGSAARRDGLTTRDEALPQCGTIIFFCWYCDKSERFQALGCSKTAVAAAEKKASEYTAQVPWLGSNALPPRNPQRDLCPFTLAIAKAETCAKEEANVESLVLGTANSTLVRRYWNVELPMGRTPRLFSIPVTYTEAEIVAPIPIQNSGFGLIKSDGLQMAPKWRYFFPLVQPLSKVFWIAIEISNFVVALAILGLHWSSVNHQKFAESFYSVAVVLLDQTQDVPSAERTDLGAESNTVECSNLEHF